MNPKNVLVFRKAEGGYKIVTEVEIQNKVTNPLKNMLFVTPRREKNGIISDEARTSVVYEAKFLQALTSPEGEDTANHLGGIVELLGYEGPTLEEQINQKEENKTTERKKKPKEPAFTVRKGTPIDQLQLDNDEKIIVAFDVSYTLSRLHKWGIVHGDVKPDNIIDVYGIFKLCDLGFAGVYDHEKLPEHLQEKLGNMKFRMGGTLSYTAPELLDGFGPDFGFESSSSTFSDSSSSYSESVDLSGESSQVYTDSQSCHIPSSSSTYAEIDQSTTPTQAEVYSFGVTLYELISGETPFVENETIIEQILEGPMPIAYQEGTLDYELHKIAFECMNQDETQRPSMVEVHHKIAGVAEKFGMEIPMYNSEFID